MYINIALVAYVYFWRGKTGAQHFSVTSSSYNQIGRNGDRELFVYIYPMIMQSIVVCMCQKKFVSNIIGMIQNKLHVLDVHFKEGGERLALPPLFFASVTHPELYGSFF